MADVHDDSAVVRPLGILSLGEIGRVFTRHCDELRETAGVLAEVDRVGMAAYLRGGTIVFAAMEHTKDVLDGVFETPGGSGILTDGSYYWRRDSADYVEHYGIGLSREFVAHVQKMAWLPPELPAKRVLEIDRFLMDRARGR